MDTESLLRTALKEARQAFGLTHEPSLQFEPGGIEREWDQTTYRNTFEIQFRVERCIRLVDLELNTETGEVLSWLDRVKLEETSEGFLSREEAIRIAERAVQMPEGDGSPHVYNVVEHGKQMMAVTWTFRVPQLEAESKIVEVLINPQTKEVCGVRHH